MKVLIFGATGMVGQGVLRECLRASDVEVVTTVGRSATGRAEPKLREMVHADMSSFAGNESELAGFDACFFCLGVSSSGMSEAEYERISYGSALFYQRHCCVRIKSLCDQNGRAHCHAAVTSARTMCINFFSTLDCFQCGNCSANQ